MSLSGENLQNELTTYQRSENPYLQAGLINLAVNRIAYSKRGAWYCCAYKIKDDKFIKCQTNCLYNRNGAETGTNKAFHVCQVSCFLSKSPPHTIEFLMLACGSGDSTPQDEEQILGKQSRARQNEESLPESFLHRPHMPLLKKRRELCIWPVQLPKPPQE